MILSYLVRRIFGRPIRNVLETVFEILSWGLFILIFLVFLGGSLAFGTVLLLLGLSYGYLSLMVVAFILFGYCTAVAVVAYMLARRSKKKVLNIIEGTTQRG